MAKKGEGRVFNICVIGLSGTEREKGQYGVGKSCLCNRFVHQVADKYHSEHISVLSQSDFAGRVINNDHFLYWGDVTKTDDGNNYTFHILEQTEFIDDVSFQPFKTGRTEPYIKRCTAVRVQSAEKLMYICKDQLGMETDSSYEQKLMPEGRMAVDGFLCCFDVSQVPQRSTEKQLEFVSSLLSAAMKTKKPVVVVSTKQDEADEQIVRDLERLLGRREFKGTVQWVETSAHDNVNIEVAFMLLAHLIDRSKPRFKILPYLDAAKQRREICQVATEAYRHLLRSSINDPRTVWNSARRRLQAEQDFTHYLDLFGTEQARNEFRRHIRHLREEQVRLREHHYLQQLPRLLKHYLPTVDTVSEKGWQTIQRCMQTHPDFPNHFVEVCPAGESWKQTEDFLDNKDEKRIPLDLLNSAEAESCFRTHLQQLQAQQRKKELQRQFKKLLEENVQVSVGRPLSETYVFLVGKECFTGLDEAERLAVYEEHQQELKAQARRSFQELLWEHSDLFWKMSATQRLTRDDLGAISNALQQDDRYRQLGRMEEERKVMILNHLGFLQCPSRDRCYYRDACIDNQLLQLLSLYSSREVSEACSPVGGPEGEDGILNLVLLGQEGLAIALNRDIRKCCADDEYNWGGVVYSLDYRPIDGDVSREQNALATANFKPHGCLCVYNSEETLLYVERSLKQWLVWQGDRDQWLAHSMPFVLMHARHPRASHKHFLLLREQGQQLAHELHTDFVEAVVEEDWEIVEEEEEEWGDQQLFGKGPIHTTLQSVISRRAGAGSSPAWPLTSAPQPDLRIFMCLMCGDPFDLDLPLGPLLSSEGVKVPSDNPYALTLQAYLEGGRQLVEVEVSSYHGRPVPHRLLTHGYILVYSAQRHASLATLRTYAMLLPAVPKLVLAVADSGGAAQLFFHNDASQALIRHGNQLADELGAVFMTTTANFNQQTAAYLPFLREVLEQREQSEAACMVPTEEPCPPYEDDRVTYMDRRPPAPLPSYYHTYPTAKSSTSNSQSTDSEPVYDQPNLYQSRYSDSDQDGASSASPLASDEIYSEVNPPDCPPAPPPHPADTPEHLVRPSYVRTRRDVCKEACGVEASSDVYWVRGKDGVSYEASNHLPPSHRHHGGSGSGRQVQAPLAVPEPIEIADYSLVKDAVAYEDTEGDYAVVEDALPQGQVHRIRSSKSPRHNHPHDGSDSEDSEFSSLERDKNGSERSRRAPRSTWQQKKSKHRSSSASGLLSSRRHRHKHAAGSHLSGSEGSEGTGDELQASRQERQRQSLRRGKFKSGLKQSNAPLSPPLSDGDLLTSPPGGDGDEVLMESVRQFQTLPGRCGGPGSLEEGVYDLNDSGHWSHRIPGFKTLRDPEKNRKKEERRRLKEEEKRTKETQKRKYKKKESKAFSPSQSGCYLEDFPTSPTTPLVPLFVEKCITFIESEGMCTEGIYRIPGNRAPGELLVSKFQEDPNVDILSLDIPINAVATVLKSFFNDLSEPLVPRALHAELMEAAGMPDKSSRLLMLRGVIKKLPEQNFEVLKYLVSHLYRVSERQEENNMDERNLSRCWWPTIMRMEFASYESMLQISPLPEEIVLTLIHQCHFFFFGGNEV
ncbi:rho GTPase-activating protein 190-like isoform X2 [Babylonia areolata]|uniref:rho GTPase-activating protein 190-like isoform X2 n=1 Tax=Babylonia areolata TaxID=304850 RepID=UPI003FD39C54